MNRLFKYIIFCSCMITFMFVISNLSKWLSPIDLGEVKSSYSGTIIDSIAYRKGLYTHVLLKRNNLKDTIIRYPEGMKLGDSVIKEPNTPYIFLKRNQKIWISKTIKIDYKSRLHKKFPVEWRCKWLDASEWDSLSQYKEEVLNICK